jgi:hypothetical protein
MRAHSRLNFVAMLVGIIVLVAIAGCGSSSSTSGESPSSPADPPAAAEGSASKADFIRAADKVCERTDARQNAAIGAYLKKHPASEKSKAGLEGLIVVAGLPPLRLEAEELASLTPPEADAKTLTALVEGIESGLAAAEANPSSLIGEATDEPFQPVDRIAAKFGFKACAHVE